MRSWTDDRLAEKIRDARAGRYHARPLAALLQEQRRRYLLDAGRSR